MIWNLDPEIFHLPEFLGSQGIRYYGLLYAVALMGGFYWWQWQMLRGGRSREVADKFLVLGVVSVLAGARLGHCLFYEPERYLADPITILYFWKGGLASHGTTVALLFAVWWFGRQHKMPMVEVGDRLAFAVAWAATLVRIGNFTNSEIVGRRTDVAWAVRFPRHDSTLLTECSGECGQVAADLCGVIRDKCYGFADIPGRHPSQLYEALLGVFVMLVLLAADRFYKGEKRPVGLILSLFLVVYFSGRFLVEYVKEFQTLQADQSMFTMGQYLSMPFVALGVVLLVRALRNPVSSESLHPADPNT